MELVKGQTPSVPPPAPEQENPMSVGEALNIVNTVLTTQYRAFDKLRGTLAAALQADADKAAQQTALDAVKQEIVQAKDELAKVRKDITAAKDSRAKVLAGLDDTQKAAQMAMAKAKIDFDRELEQQQEAFNAKLKEEALVAQTHLEDNIAGLKREINGLTTQSNAAKLDLASVTKAFQDKSTELADVQKRLDAANAALDALKARL